MVVHDIILHLSLIDGIGPATIAIVYRHMVQLTDPARIYDYDVAAWKALGLSHDRAAVLIKGLSTYDLYEKECALMQRHGVSYISLAHVEYPRQLKEIHIPPPILYYKGILPSAYQTSVAVVGSRKANRYGELVVAQIIPPLIEQGICIVSGGALGADRMAHEAALYAGGKTVAVVGSGLIQPYPRSHSGLFQMMVDKGSCIVSPFSMESAVVPGNFPVRNRIIAGMSRGCLVVQAAAESGALITAQHALEEGRDVFAVPGPINDTLSQGCHNLIKQGAHIATSADDILAHYADVFPQEHGAQENIAATKIDYQEAASCPREDLTPEQKIRVLAANPVSTDTLLEALDISFVELSSLLFELQIQGVLVQNSAGLWQALS